MNFRRLIYLPFVVSLEDLAEQAEAEGNDPIEELEDNRTPYAPISQTFHDEIYERIEPGNERAAVVLKAEGMTTREIAFVLGITQSQVYTIMQRVKKKVEPFIKKNLTRER